MDRWKETLSEAVNSALSNLFLLADNELLQDKKTWQKTEVAPAGEGVGVFKA